MNRAYACGVAVAALLTVSAGAAHADEAEELLSKTDYGLGGTVRQQRVTKRMLKLFFEDVPDGATQRGFGVNLVRRRRDLDINIGLGYDRLDGTDGFYVEKGQQATTPGKVDYVEFHKLQWFTAELTVIGHVPLHKLLAFRYGAGLGIAYLRGEIRKTDALCTSTDIDNDCAIDPNAMEVDQPADLPPVLPVINGLVGFELRPFDALAIDVDIGLHTVPYAAVSATLFLW